MKNRLRVAISTDLFVEILTTGWSGDGVQCVEGLPKGAEFVNMGYDPMSDTFPLVFQHESFPPTEPGQMLPIMLIMYRRVAPTEWLTEPLDLQQNDDTTPLE